MCASRSRISHKNSSKNMILYKQSKNGWIYFEILLGCYGLPQSGRLSNDLLGTCLEQAGYYKAATTSGLWSHKWRPIQFFLLVDNFGIKYIGKEHALHLLKNLEQNYDISIDWKGTKFAGIDLACDYNIRLANQTCRISMDGFITIVFLKYGHPCPRKLQLSPHKHGEVIYGAKEQLTPEYDTIPPLDNQGTKRVQGIVGAL